MSKILYGIPYMGSKTGIALDILKQLPKGKRFVDLFGGGFAMSHAALLSNRYDCVWYNDYSTILVELIKKALAGEYNYDVFKPPFVSREQFEREKDKDGYIRYIWSFGNKGEGYLFGRDVEPLKRAAHNFIVFGEWDSLLNELTPRAYNYVTAADIHTRRLQYRQYINALHKRFDLQQLEQLERLQQLEQLERLEVTNLSYQEYVYREGDIVYCDPPYEGTAQYVDAFDSNAFYDWCASRPYQVWFSSYEISDNRFKMLWAKRKRTTLGTDNKGMNFERLYTNKRE